MNNCLQSISKSTQGLCFWDQIEVSSPVLCLDQQWLLGQLIITYVLLQETDHIVGRSGAPEGSLVDASGQSFRHISGQGKVVEWRWPLVAKLKFQQYEKFIVISTEASAKHEMK